MQTPAEPVIINQAMQPPAEPVIFNQAIADEIDDLTNG